ncbi:hypothetical protein SAMN04488078_104918 [Antarctobacter heliothermus]|uniref:Uncharacterized protein n=1 Tax=Antarctobacter heliothermus TaxID=74033 RepID=A0A239J6J2_9RHOB|nr:hypothetical protein SAMN04488078_104918 [Antarctobacter heliothermus]
MRSLIKLGRIVKFFCRDTYCNLTGLGGKFEQAAQGLPKPIRVCDFHMTLNSYATFNPMIQTSEQPTKWKIK